MAMLCAVAALDKFINDNKIRAMSKRNLSNIWYLVCGTSVDELRKTALIANCMQEPVQFEVMSRHEEFAFYHCDVKYMKWVYLPTSVPNSVCRARPDSHGAGWSVRQ